MDLNFDFTISLAYQVAQKELHRKRPSVFSWALVFL